MSSNFLRCLFIVLVTFSCVKGCLLCPFRTPPMPKPLDQIRIPSVEKIIDMSDALIQMCQNRTTLSFAGEICRRDVADLVCAFRDLYDNYMSECPASENKEECKSCRNSKSQKYAKSSWIQTWIDSFGKMPSGISEGNYHWLGDYEQCQNLRNGGFFNGHYCLVDFAIPSSVSDLECDHNQALEVSLGACLPATCDPQETTQLVQHVAKHSVHIRCEPRPEWTLTAVIVISALILWITVLWLATCFHWWSDLAKWSPVSSSIVLALSLQRNTSDCLRTKRKESHDFEAVSGIKVISVVLLVSGYVFYLMLPYVENPIFSYEMTERFTYQPLVNFSFYVDGFLALSALALALKPIEKFSSLRSLTQQLVKHFFKIWPTYAFITLFVATVYGRLGEGPMWSHNDLPKRCEEHWLWNVLLINNLVGDSVTCLDTGFLIALEAQFFVFGALSLYLITRFRRFTLYTLLGLWFGSIIYTFVVAFSNNVYATLIPTKNLEDLFSYGVFVNKIYLHPFSRVAPFIIGLIVPLTLPKKFPKNLTTAFNTILFTLAWVITAVIMWTPYYIEKESNENPRFWHAAYAALHRPAWASIVIYMAYSLNNAGPRNLRNSILSWRVFYPLSKLVYLVFLISEPVSLSLFASLHRPIYSTAGSTLLTCLGGVLFSYVFAFLFDIIIVRPFRHLADIPFSGLSSHSSV